MKGHVRSCRNDKYIFLYTPLIRYLGTCKMSVGLNLQRGQKLETEVRGGDDVLFVSLELKCSVIAQ